MLDRIIPTFLENARAHVDMVAAGIELGDRQILHVDATFAPGLPSDVSLSDLGAPDNEPDGQSAHARALLAGTCAAIERIASDTLASDGCAPFCAFQYGTNAGRGSISAMPVLVGHVGSAVLGFRDQRPAPGLPPRQVSFLLAALSEHHTDHTLIRQVGQALADAQPDGPFWTVRGFEDDITWAALPNGSLRIPAYEDGRLFLTVAAPDPETALRRALLYMLARQALAPIPFHAELRLPAVETTSGEPALTPDAAREVHQAVRRSMAGAYKADRRWTDVTVPCQQFLAALPRGDSHTP